MSDIGVAKRKKKTETSELAPEQKKLSIRDEIRELEKEISGTKVNKRTEGAVGLLKAKLSRLREKAQSQGSKKSGSSDGFNVRKSGDATVVLLGFPSVGKSTILNKITGKESETGAYAFTTLSVVPGMLKHNYAQIQILDVPGIVRGAAAGAGKGKEVLATMRNADLVLIVLDATNPSQLSALKDEAYAANLRLDQIKPDVKITQKSRGGIRIGKTCPVTKIEDDTIIKILKEFKISNADVVIREDIDADQLIDVIEDNRKYVKSLTVINKIDMLSDAQREKIIEDVKPELVMSAHKGIGIPKLKDKVYTSLEFIRIFTKEVGKEADMGEPLIMFEGCTIGDVCNKLHKDFFKKFKFARVWGDSAKFPGQRLMLHHTLADGDVVEIHAR